MCYCRSDGGRSQPYAQYEPQRVEVVPRDRLRQLSRGALRAAVGTGHVHRGTWNQKDLRNAASQTVLPCGAALSVPAISAPHTCPCTYLAEPPQAMFPYGRPKKVRPAKRVFHQVFTAEALLHVTIKSRSAIHLAAWGHVPRRYAVRTSCHLSVGMLWTSNSTWDTRDDYRQLESFVHEPKRPEASV